MRSSTYAIIAASGAFAFAACGQIGSPIDAGVDAADDAHADGGLTFPETGADHYVVPPPPTHDAGPPDGATLTIPCVDAGTDAPSFKVCPPPKPYCDDEYSVSYSAPPLPPVTCNDAGTCVFTPTDIDCLPIGCDQTTGACNVVIGE